MPPAHCSRLWSFVNPRLSTPGIVAGWRRVRVGTKSHNGYPYGSEDYMFLLARIVRLITMVVVGVIVAGIVLHLFDANSGNAIVSFVYDVAGWLVTPFKNVFS